MTGRNSAPGDGTATGGTEPMEQQQDFWNFSVATYGKAGVAEACLHLQEEIGIDVNVLLYCCWYGCTRGTLDRSAMERILSIAEPWAENVVRPLRAARTWMKAVGCDQPFLPGDECMALREEIKRAELKAEHLQENRMQALTRGAALQDRETLSQVHSTLANTGRYFRHLNVDLDDESGSRLAHVVTAAVTGANLDTVTDSLNRTLAGTPERPVS